MSFPDVLKQHVQEVESIITAFLPDTEFPGGKVEPGESPEDALVREIREELDSEISVDEYISTIEHDYPEFHLSMRCYWCSLISGDLVLKEAEDAKWLDVETIDSVKWLPADITLIDEIKKRMA